MEDEFILANIKRKHLNPLWILNKGKINKYELDEVFNGAGSYFDVVEEV